MRVWLRPVGDLQGPHERRNARRQFIHLVAGSSEIASWTVPELPSTVIFWPSCSWLMASGYADHGGNPVFAATVGPCGIAEPVSVTSPPALRNSGVHPGSVVAVTRMSPARCALSPGRGRCRSRRLPLRACRRECSRRGARAVSSGRFSGMVPSESSNPGIRGPVLDPLPSAALQDRPRLRRGDRTRRPFCFARSVAASQRQLGVQKPGLLRRHPLSWGCGGHGGAPCAIRSGGSSCLRRASIRSSSVLRAGLEPVVITLPSGTSKATEW
jgi:hypothetical protein